MAWYLVKFSMLPHGVVLSLAEGQLYLYLKLLMSLINPLSTKLNRVYLFVYLTTVIECSR